MAMKCLWTLNVDDYAPEITAITYPWFKRYASKCGMEFRVISERKFPDRPAVYEKLQLADLGRAYDWNLYLDSDALVHPDFIDLTVQIPKSTIMHYGCDLAPNRFASDPYFQRDGRNIGSCNWFTLTSDWCLDLWAQPDIAYEECLKRIFPTTNERNVDMNPSHLIDDYILSRNIARFGLKVLTVGDWFKSIGHPDEHYLFHEYTLQVSEKVLHMKRMLYKWGLWKEAGLPEPPKMGDKDDSLQMPGL